MRSRSPPVTSASLPSRRFRFEDFFSRMWFLNALRRMSLPVLVTLKRLAAPRWVFIFGIEVLPSSRRRLVVVVASSGGVVRLGLDCRFFIHRLFSCRRLGSV